AFRVSAPSYAEDRLKEQALIKEWRPYYSGSDPAVFKHALDKDWPKIKKLIRKGIPTRYRRDIWQGLLRTEELVRAERRRAMPQGPLPPYEQMNPLRSNVPAPPTMTRYEGLVRDKNIKFDPVIIRDVTRTYPTCAIFRDHSHSKQLALYQVLRAYSVFNPSVGYTQGMGFIAGALLMYMSPLE
ncbi:hypothetical protein KIPB_012986, partial [Kipferlia bialata]